MHDTVERKVVQIAPRPVTKRASSRRLGASPITVRIVISVSSRLNHAGRSMREGCAGQHDQTATPSRRLHAAGQHPHRCLALSWRLSRREFQPRAPEELRPDAGTRQVRCILHGRPSGRAQHADRSAEAQPHRDLVRTVHAAVGVGDGDRPHWPDRHRFHHLRRAVSRRATLRLARPYQRRSRRLEHRHHIQPGRGAEFRPRRAHGA